MPKIEIGKLWTGKREVHYDTINGTYREAKPALDDHARLLQAALCPKTFVVRAPNDIRQPH
jgi:hypothetical protein